MLVTFNVISSTSTDCFKLIKVRIPSNTECQVEVYKVIFKLFTACWARFLTVIFTKFPWDLLWSLIFRQDQGMAYVHNVDFLIYSVRAW